MGDGEQRGTKRKRYEPPEEHHDCKEVRKAAKKAKVFETQKLVKKLKDLRRKDDNDQAITEHESQLTAIKDIDHDDIGNTALKTKLLKDHMLSENEHIQMAISEELASNLLTPAPPGSAMAKIQSRLLSSKVLASEIGSVIEALRNLLQPKPQVDDTVMEESIEDSAPPRSKKTKAAIKADTVDMDIDIEPLAIDDNEEFEADPDIDDAEPVDESGWESGTIGDDEHEADDGWESGLLDEDPTGSADEEDETGFGDSDSDAEMISLKPPSKLVKAAPKPSKITVSASATQSTFLPSLAVGFVRGTDDSDFSDSEMKMADGDIKKNRRGQRARRAIWEKKYGRNANHKKKEAEEQSAPGRGNGKHDAYGPLGSTKPQRNAPKPYVGASGNARQLNNADNVVQHLQQPDAGWGQRSGPGSNNMGPMFKGSSQPPLREERPLHPSWEAKKKLKEKESGGIIPSQGKKIKF
ncbi:Bud-site selection protein [Crucibulum laeve]|uniref:Bud-site selection protein n=1 Tax=Crucibulum laeve TaxID=68775 RepID=A0A5C3M6R1_9AGAR|nr:Bud-site selection protein [Crucibulum laeve]